MIYSWTAKRWTLPVKIIIGWWLRIFGAIERFAPSFAHYISWLKVGEPTQLKEMAKCIAYVSEHGAYERWLYNQEFRKYSEMFDEEQVKKGYNNE